MSSFFNSREDEILFQKLRYGTVLRINADDSLDTSFLTTPVTCIRREIVNIILYYTLYDFMLICLNTFTWL